MSAEPFTAFAFAVELRLPGSDAPLCEAAFCECEGLELRREIIRARDGADPASVRLLPGAESFGNVILRRGMTSSFAGRRSVCVPRDSSPPDRLSRAGPT